MGDRKCEWCGTGEKLLPGIDECFNSTDCANRILERKQDAQGAEIERLKAEVERLRDENAAMGGWLENFRNADELLAKARAALSPPAQGEGKRWDGYTRKTKCCGHTLPEHSDMRCNVAGCACTTGEPFLEFVPRATPPEEANPHCLQRGCTFHTGPDQAFTPCLCKGRNALCQVCGGTGDAPSTEGGGE